jgi:hypothetical protein
VRRIIRWIGNTIAGIWNSPGIRFIRQNPRQVIHETTDDILYVGSATSITGLLTRYLKMALYCDPQDIKCTRDINSQATTIAVALFYLPFFILLLKSLQCTAGISGSRLFRVPVNFLNMLFDCLGNHEFLLRLIVFILLEKGVADVDTPPFLEHIVVPTAIGGVLLNTQVRRLFKCQWIEDVAHDGDRNRLDIAFDMVAQGIRGSATGNGLVAAVEGLTAKNLFTSIGARAARYSIGGIWGVAQAGLACRYSPLFEVSKILETNWPALLNSLLSSIIFMAYTATNIKNSKEENYNIEISLAVLLLASVLILQCFKARVAPAALLAAPAVGGPAMPPAPPGVVPIAAPVMAIAAPGAAPADDADEEENPYVGLADIFDEEENQYAVKRESNKKRPSYFLRAPVLAAPSHEKNANEDSESKLLLSLSH